MGYDKMWKEMKEHYEKRVEKSKDKEFDSPINARSQAKSVLNVMAHFELKEKDKRHKHADISINDLRAMAEDL